MRKIRWLIVMAMLTLLVPLLLLAAGSVMFVGLILKEINEL